MKLTFTSILIFFALAGNVLAGTYSGGSGTASVPYQIATLNDLLELSQTTADWSAHFIQTADINAASTSGWNGGAGFSPIGGSGYPFRGTYNGNGHTIDNLFIKRSTSGYIALFGFVFNPAVLTDIHLTNVNFEGEFYVAALAGWNEATVRNCSASGNIVAADYVAGGLISMNLGDIFNSYSSCSVTSSNYAGGLVGSNNGDSGTGYIVNCYARGSVSSPQRTGGLIGYIVGGKVENCYSTASVNSGSSPSSSNGGLIGRYFSGTITNSFWDTEASGQSSSQGGTGKTTAEMKTLSTFLNAGWDFEVETNNGSEDIWDIDNASQTINDGYPFFDMQNGSAISVSTVVPTITVSNPSSLLTAGSPVSYNIEYSGAATVNLSAANITLNKTGSADGTVTVANGTTIYPTVTISDLTGIGTLGISIASGTSASINALPDTGAGASATFAVVDSTPPNAICQDITISLDPHGQSLLTAEQIDNGSSDNIGIDTMWLNNYNFSCSELGDNDVTLYVSDDAGNVDFCEAIVTVTDTTVPVYMGEELFTYYASDSTCDAHVALSAGQETQELIYSETFNQNNNYCPGSPQYDNWVNIRNQIIPGKVKEIRASSSLSSETLVLDEVDLVQQIALALKNGTDLSVTAIDGNVWTVDTGCSTGCSNETDAIELNVNAFGTCSCSGASTGIVFRPCIGNSNWGGFGTQTCSAQTQTLTLVIVHKPDIFYSDNCVITRTLLSGLSDTADYPLGTTTNTYKLEDQAGNFIIQDVTIEVLDTVKPIVLCKDILIPLGQSGTTTITASQLDDDSYDNCDIDTMWLDKYDFTIADEGSNAVTLSVQDVSGNISTCMATVTLDATLPEVTCQNIGIVLDENGQARIYPAFVTKEATDNVGIVSYSLDISRFNCSDLGKNMVVLTAKDYVGNTSTCTSTVTVYDRFAPEAICQDIEISLNDQGIAVIDSSMIDDGSSDGCEIVAMTLSQYVFTNVDLGENTVTLTVSDAGGNEASCEAKVIVKDEIAPVASCNSIDITLSADSYMLSDDEIVMIAGSSSDNASPYDSLQIEITPSTFNCSDIGDSINVSVTVTDEAGNESTCEAMVYVHSALETQIDDVEVNLNGGICESAIDYPALLTAESCVTITQLDGLGPDGVFPVGTTVETWEVVNNGITDTMSFSVIVTTNNLAPTLDSIMSIDSVGHLNELIVPLTGISFGGDCADQDVTISATSVNTEITSNITVNYTSPDSTGELMLEVADFASGSDTITVTVEDSEGASVSRTFVVSVEYTNQAPVLVNPLEDQEVNAGQELMITRLAGIFDDQDGDTLNLEVTTENNAELPGWMVLIDDTLYATPSIADTGCVTLVVTATDPSMTSASDTFIVCALGFLVGIEDINTNTLNLNLYPNPSKGQVTVEFDNPVTGDIELLVTDIAGKRILQKTYHTQKLIQFDISDQVSGIYLVNIQYEKQYFVRKLILNDE